MKLQIELYTNTTHDGTDDDKAKRLAALHMLLTEYISDVLGADSFGIHINVTEETAND